ncbi:Uu.00g028040.m01.CDS01 [Anthostomella pinea]|uniref:Uu.00g028040.m01.CDS01 n=1 Tax=Anthostomella pinea TaxID=933095 RepID=A0AAI8YCN6_9PEZI|nr:Uu.00g028040.m01.CDS01 [Anthostomella pinea]
MSLIPDNAEDYSSDNQSNASSSGDEDLGPPPLLHHNYFAPPFYGRPPTPLPPSPSLTSLLRPSRPTTPDASDDDLEAPVPRASPKVPTYEYYGFVLYLFSSLTFLVYILWAFLPSPFLHAMGIYYYPNRWWALAVPSFIVMLLVYIYIALALYNTEVLTLPLNSIETITDEAAQIATIDSEGRIKPALKHPGLTPEQASKLEWKKIWNEGTDAVMDVPLSGVCMVLYGHLLDSEEELQEGSEEQLQQGSVEELQHD